ncbi:hypothetical protein BDR22DRAFT_64878 [Usnea florida]
MASSSCPLGTAIHQGDIQISFCTDCADIISNYTFDLTMRFPILLPLGLVIVSAMAHATKPAGTCSQADSKSRCLSTGASFFLPTTAVPPKPTLSIISSRVSSTTSAFTAVPSGVSKEFSLVVANTSTPFDGLFLDLHYGTVGDEVGDLVFSEFKNYVPGGTTVFILDADGTLQADNSGEGNAYYVRQGSNSSSGFFFQNPPGIPREILVTCELVGDTFDGDILTCQNGATGLFFAFPQTVIDGNPTTPFVQLGPTVPYGAYQLTLLTAVD